MCTSSRGKERKGREEEETKGKSVRDRERKEWKRNRERTLDVALDLCPRDIGRLVPLLFFFLVSYEIPAEESRCTSAFPVERRNIAKEEAEEDSVVLEIRSPREENERKRFHEFPCASLRSKESFVRWQGAMNE